MLFPALLRCGLVYAEVVAMVCFVWCWALWMLPRPSWLGLAVGCGGAGVLRVWLPVRSCCGLLVASVGGCFACSGGVARGWCSLSRPFGVCLPLWLVGGPLVPSNCGPHGRPPPPLFFFGAYRWFWLGVPVPLPVVPAVSAAPLMVVRPVLGRGLLLACRGWSFVWLGGGPSPLWFFFACWGLLPGWAG